MVRESGHNGRVRRVPDNRRTLDWISGLIKRYLRNNRLIESEVWVTWRTCLARTRCSTLLAVREGYELERGGVNRFRFSFGVRDGPELMEITTKAMTIGKREREWESKGLSDRVMENKIIHVFMSFLKRLTNIYFFQNHIIESFHFINILENHINRELYENFISIKFCLEIVIQNVSKQSIYKTKNFFLENSMKIKEQTECKTNPDYNSNKN